MIHINKAILPLSGFTHDFLPATKTMPKEMMPIVDRPLIQYAVEEAANAGFTDIIFITGRGKRIIEDHFDKAYELEEELAAGGKNHVLAELRQQLPANMNFSSLHLRNEYGYGDALLDAQAFIGREPFAVVMPDQLIDGDPSALRQIKDTFLSTGQTVIGMQKLSDKTPAGVQSVNAALPAQQRFLETRYEGGNASPADSFGYVGRYIFTPAVFECLSRLKAGGRERIELQDALSELSTVENVMQCDIRGRRYDCSKKMDCMKAMIEFGLKHPAIGSELSAYVAALKARKRIRPAAQR